MAVKELICPQCKKPISTLDGFRHDSSLNLLCGLCDQVVFPATKEAENKHRNVIQGLATSHVSWQKTSCLPIRLNSTPAASETHCPPGRTGECCDI